MKKIITAAAILLFVAACKEDIELTSAVSFTNSTKSSIPVTLLNPAGKSWKVSPADASCYTSGDKISPPSASMEKSKLIDVRFEAGGNFTFIYEAKDHAVVQVKGKAIFTNMNGHPIFKLQPVEGIKTTGGITALIKRKELKETYSTQYLWEHVNISGMPKDNFLLLVDIDTHPMAGTVKTVKIDRSCVSKFYLR